jgi:hypothetical protein
VILTDDELVAVVTAVVQAILAATPETQLRRYDAFDDVLAMPPYATREERP